MQTLKNFAFKRPVLFSTLLIAVAIAFTEIPLEKALSALMEARSAVYVGQAFLQYFASVMLFILLVRFDLVRAVGFRFDNWKDLWIAWPMLLLTLVNASDLLTGSLVIDSSRPDRVALYTLLYIAAGIFEEILCRGVVIFVMLKKWGSTRKGMYAAVLVSSVLFSLGHFANWIQGRFSPLADLTQVCFAVFFGVFFAACVLRNRSIWPAALLHAAFDFVGAAKEISVGGKLFGEVYTISWESALTSILLTLPLFIYGLFIVRKVSPQVLFAETI
jgi:uncharacterized protein